MRSDEAAGRNAASAAQAAAAAAGEPRYDAFVLRLWHEAAGEELLRAEIEHVGSGTRTRAAAVGPEWVLAQVQERLAERALGDSTLAAADGRVP